MHKLITEYINYHGTGSPPGTAPGVVIDSPPGRQHATDPPGIHVPAGYTTGGVGGTVTGGGAGGLIVPIVVHSIKLLQC